MSDIATLNVKTPGYREDGGLGGLYQHEEEDRLSMPRDEGPTIVLQVAENVDRKLKVAVENTPLTHNPENYFLEADEDRKAYENWNKNSATLFVNGDQQIEIVRVATGRYEIEKRQNDPEGWVPGNVHYGSRGTRKFNVDADNEQAFEESDVDRIITGLQKMNVELPDTFRADLFVGIRSASPKICPEEEYLDEFVSNPYKSEDQPGEDYTKRYKQLGSAAEVG